MVRDVVYRVILCVSVLALCGTFLGCFQHQSGRSMREQADTLSKRQQYDEAIEAYWKHIRLREGVENKPDWENPYIYLLDIGDIYLAMSNFEKALETFELAETKGVKPGYVNDRLRYVGTLYEEQGELHKAIEHLQKYRDRDEILFDLMLNRLARQIVTQEEQHQEQLEVTGPIEESKDLNVLEATRALE